TGDAQRAVERLSVAGVSEQFQRRIGYLAGFEPPTRRMCENPLGELTVDRDGPRQEAAEGKRFVELREQRMIGESFAARIGQQAGAGGVVHSQGVGGSERAVYVTAGNRDKNRRQGRLPQHRAPAPGESEAAVGGKPAGDSFVRRARRIYR